MELEITVSDQDIDDLGHVNNARFLAYFERGRLDWYNSIGLFGDLPPDRRLGTVVVSITINYRRECFQGERLRVRNSPLSRGKKSYVLRQEIRNGSGELVADADVTSVVMDLDARRAVELPEALATQFDRNDRGKERQ